jgi:hypothetical protein
MSQGESALKGEWESVENAKFERTDHARRLHWKPAHRGLIVIGDQRIIDGPTTSEGDAEVPANVLVEVFRMTVKFTP